MRKFICLIFAWILCIGLGCQIFAADHKFVPSITYKDGPEIESAELGTEPVADCLVVTTIKKAEDKETDITQDDRDQLLDVYEQLLDGTMELPLQSGYVIRELLDVSFKETVCIQPDHNHDLELEKPDVKLTVVFDLEIPVDEDLKVYVYHDGEWKEVVEVINDGKTVTVVFEDICPVAFCVSNSNVESPKTGDTFNMLLWMLMLLMSGTCLVWLMWRKAR